MEIKLPLRLALALGTVIGANPAFAQQWNEPTYPTNPYPAGETQVWNEAEAYSALPTQTQPTGSGYDAGGSFQPAPVEPQLQPPQRYPLPGGFAPNPAPAPTNLSSGTGSYETSPWGPSSEVNARPIGFGPQEGQAELTGPSSEPGLASPAEGAQLETSPSDLDYFEPQPADDSGVLSEYPSTGAHGTYAVPSNNPYNGSVWDETSACVACGLDSCNGGCGNSGQSVWFGGLYGLIMERDYAATKYLSYYNGMPSEAVLLSDDVDLGSLGGYEIFFGRHYCNGWAWQVSYWGLYSEREAATVNGYPDTLLYATSMPEYDPMGYANNTAQYWYNGAASHQIIRENEFHNVELNFFRFGGVTGANACGPCGYSQCGPNPRRVAVSGFMGARYFNFDEFYSYRSSWDGMYNYDVRDMFYDIDVDNHLVGFQLGGNMDYALTCRLSVFGGTKMGVYNNHVQHRQRMYGVSGYATPATGSWSGQDYNLESTKDDVAFLGEFNLGLAFQFSSCWRAVVGYRALGIAGVALAPNQIPNNMTFYPDVRQVDSDGSLLMHGAFVGLEWVR